jgi:hypothetical protein
MKNKFYLPMISLLATVTFMFSSCDNDDSSDTTKPLIELHEPEEGQALVVSLESSLSQEENMKVTVAKRLIIGR